MRRFMEFINTSTDTSAKFRIVKTNQPEHIFIAIDSIIAVRELLDSDKIQLELNNNSTITVIGDYEEVKSWLLEENDRLV